MVGTDKSHGYCLEMICTGWLTEPSIGTFCRLLLPSASAAADIGDFQANRMWLRETLLEDRRP
jgi:hypothetical protein